MFANQEKNFAVKRPGANVDRPPRISSPSPNRSSGRTPIEIGAHGPRATNFSMSPWVHLVFWCKEGKFEIKKLGWGAEIGPTPSQIDCKSGFECGQSRSVDDGAISIRHCRRCHSSVCRPMIDRKSAIHFVQQTRHHIRLRFGLKQSQKKGPHFSKLLIDSDSWRNDDLGLPSIISYVKLTL